MNGPDTMQLILFDQGKLSEEEAIELFQKLIDSGDAWRLPGYYGRTAMWLIEEGLCMFGPVRTTTYWNQTMPSRFDVPDDRPGSAAYYKRRQSKLQQTEATKETP